MTMARAFGLAGAVTRLVVEDGIGPEPTVMDLARRATRTKRETNHSTCTAWTCGARARSRETHA